MSLTLISRANCQSFGRFLCLIFLIAIAACSSEEAEPEGLKIVPLFGAEREVISSDVDWFGTKVGVFESERRTEDGELFGFNWQSRLDSLGEDGIYPVTEGEIGVELAFSSGGTRHYSTHVLPASDNKAQVIEIVIEDMSRIILDAEGLNDDALTELTIDTPKRGSTTGTTGWRNQKGVHYFSDPGRYRVKLTNSDSGESHSEEVLLGNGETGKIGFKFTQ